MGTGEDRNYIDFRKRPDSSFFLAGTDEVGRGPLAGPVVAATVLALAVKSEKNFWEELLGRLDQIGVADSKKLNQRKREKIVQDLGIRDLKVLQAHQCSLLNIAENGIILFSIAEISSQEIDQINILKASQKAMISSFQICLDGLADFNIKKKRFGKILIDGHLPLKMENREVEEVPLVKGDGRSLLIGLSSILAKSYRDFLMTQMSMNYPHYGFEKNAGYPTATHREAIKRLGPSPIHRLTFKGVSEYAGKL